MARKYKKLVVTAKDIRTARKLKNAYRKWWMTDGHWSTKPEWVPSQQCPLAQAVARKQNLGFHIEGTIAHLEDGSWQYTQRTFDFIQDFDRRRPVKPGTYYLYRVVD